MSRRRKERRARPAAAAPTQPARSIWRPPAPLTIDIAAGVTILLCIALAWFSRGNLNVDGVSYLDLAGRIRAGDWSALVQGYWSPLYPVLLALVLAVGSSGSAAIAIAHALNAAIAITLVVVLWRWVRQRGDVGLALFAFTAFLVASARTPRIDAVTPDLLLILVLVLMGLELMRAQGWRGVRVGLLASLAFLVKTSAWPWLIVVSLIAGIATWRDPGRRREWLRAVAVGAAPLLAWAGLLSAQAGRPTMGDTGPLGACWYLRGCDGRSPDTHKGGHVAYQTWQLDDTLTVKAAVYEPVQWTYAPWSDVSAWQRGITSQRKDPIDPFNYVEYALTQAGFVVRYWVAWLALMVLIPMMITRRADTPILRAAGSVKGFLMAAGVIGVLQFVAVHAEPRLIGPYVMLAALGFLAWRAEAVPRQWEWLVAAASFLIAIGVGVEHLRDQHRVTTGSIARASAVEEHRPDGEAPHRVAVIGPAFPVVPDLYRTRSAAVVQLMVDDAESVTRYPIPAQLALMDHFRKLGATTMWFSHGRDGYRMVVMPSAAQAAANAAAAEIARQLMEQQQ